MGNDKRGWDDSLISLGLGALVVVVSGILLYNFFSSTSKDLLNDLANSNRGQTSSTQVEVVQAPSPTPAEVVAGIVTPLPEATLTASPSAIAIATAQPTATVIAKATPSTVPTQIAKASPSVATTQVAMMTPSASPVAVAEVTKTAPVNTTTEGTVKDSYTVVRGDSLWKISEKFYGTGYDWKSIQKANNLEGKSLIAGMTIEVPRQGMTSSTATVATSANPAQGDGSTISAPSTTPAVGGVSTVSVSYTVVKGDSLSTIAYKQCGNQFLWEKLAQDNKLANPRLIEIGQVLQVSCKR